MNAVVARNPKDMHGAPCFAGTRVTVRSLFDHLAAGYTVEGFLQQFPTVKREQVMINPNSEAKVAMLIELYRQDKLSRYELSLALGLTRFETDALLKKHHVTEDLPTPEEIEQDLRHLRQLVGK